MSPSSRPVPSPRTANRTFAAGAVVGGLVVVLFALSPSEGVRGACFVLLGAGTVAALLVAPRLHHLARPAGWRLLAAGCLAFGVGAVLRPTAIELDGPARASSDAFTVPGYLLTAAGLVVLFRLRAATLDRHALADGVIIAVGAAMAAVTFLALPAAQVPGRPLWLTALSALYPVLDVLLLLVLVQISFTRRARSTSFRLLTAALGALLLGDLGYAVIGREGQLVGPHWLDTLFAVSYLLLGLCALHPSARLMSHAPPVRVQAWTRSRLALLLPALAVPPVLLLLVGGAGLGTRVTLATGSAVIILVLVVRSLASVRDYALSQQVFRHQATHDALTGLPNRTLLAERLEQSLARQAARYGRTPACPGTALLFLDLDGFKLVNDSWGHDRGDELLVAVAQRLEECAPVGSTVARVGGDEFLVCLETAGDPEAGTRLAALVLERLRVPFRLSVAEVVVTGSVGVAHGDPRSTPETLISDADTAMYRAKAAGRSQAVVFDPTMREEVRRRVELELALRHAVELGQTSLVYQPLVRLADESLVAVEALLRWHHDVLGHVSPRDFIPVAEDTGLISELGDWVLESALDQLLAWRAAGEHPRLQMSVNVSGRQLRQADFAVQVEDALLRRGLAGACLCVEITESVALENSAEAVSNLHQLHAMGVRLAIDDFGTGYSSLSYLRRLPVDAVKIDQSFVAGLGRNDEDAEIVRAAVAMAHALGLTVVAEGVETPLQRDHLRALGVDHAQGYLFGRPGPAGSLRAPGATARGAARLPGAAFP